MKISDIDLSALRWREQYENTHNFSPLRTDKYH